MTNLSLLLLSLLITSSLSMTQVTILNPPLSTTQFGKDPALNQTIPSVIGNFGDIPYGVTLTGYVFYKKNKDGTNYWCDPEQIEDFNLPTSMQFPIFLVDDTGCSYATKAENVHSHRGLIMMLISDQNELKDEYNSDIDSDRKINVFSVVIPKKNGEMLKELSSTLNGGPNSTGSVILQISFNNIRHKSNVDIEFFFRSDDLKALSFFQEFKVFADRLQDKMTFNPIYKYNKFEYPPEKSSSKDNDQNPCIKNLCTGRNHELKIASPRLVLLENMRQSCIHQSSQDDYWNYMVAFYELCADVNNPNFTEKCALNAMKVAHIKKSADEIKNCMDILETRDQTKMETDYQKYEDRKVYKVPELVINGVKYRGTWLGKSIFNAICAGYLDDPDACRPNTLAETKEGRMSNVKIFFIVVIIFTIVLFVLLICYRRIVDKTMNTDYQDMINKQTMFSIEKSMYGKNQVKSDDA